MSPGASKPAADVSPVGLHEVAYVRGPARCVEQLNHPIAVSGAATIPRGPSAVLLSPTSPADTPLMRAEVSPGSPDSPDLIGWGALHARVLELEMVSAYLVARSGMSYGEARTCAAAAQGLQTPLQPLQQL